MKKNNFFVFGLAFSLLFFSACENEVDPQGAPMATKVNRLIFEAEAESGGHLKVELSDTHIESLLDGNQSGITTPLLIPSNSYVLPLHQSLASFSFTDVNYYGVTIADITCSSNPESKFPLLWVGPLGDYYEGFNGYLYLDDIIGGSQYVLQSDNEVINSAAVAEYFYADCTSSDGNAYRVSFYPPSDPLSHSIQTTFSVDKGILEGIVRLHRVGDGYTPYIDLLF